MEKSKITKKVKQEMKNLIDNKGYWSKEVREYLEEFAYPTRQKMHTMMQVYEKYQYGL